MKKLWIFLLVPAIVMGIEIRKKGKFIYKEKQKVEFVDKDGDGIADRFLKKLRKKMAEKKEKEKKIRRDIKKDSKKKDTRKKKKLIIKKRRVR